LKIVQYFTKANARKFIVLHMLCGLGQFCYKIKNVPEIEYSQAATVHYDGGPTDLDSWIDW